MSSFALPHTLHGAGTHKVIAVHGWFADRTAWEPLFGDLDTERLQYAFVDLRGYGEAAGAHGEFTTSEAASDVLALADALGWDRFSVVGHSMGGSVAQRVLVSASDRVRRLVGVSPVPACGLDMPPEQWGLFAGADKEPGNRRAILDITTGGARPDAWLDRMVSRSLRCSDTTAFRAYLDSWAREDFHAELEGSAVPALAVAGALDPALSAALMRTTWMTWFAQGELAELSAAGHYAMDETPLELLRVVEDFLRADEESAADPVTTPAAGTAKTTDRS